MLDNKTDDSKIAKPINSGRVLRFALFSLILGIIIFIFSYISMRDHIGLDKLNQPILNWMLDHRFKLFTETAKIITSFAGLMSITIIVSIISAGFLFIKHEVWRPFLLVGSIVVSSITSLLLKSMIMDSRPPQIDMIPAFETDYSFPSGHTIAIAVFLLVLGYLIYSRNYSRFKIFAWFGIAIVGTSLIALTRLYLGYHWLTDVAASIGLALVILSLVIFADHKYRKKFTA